MAEVCVRCGRDDVLAVALAGEEWVCAAHLEVVDLEQRVATARGLLERCVDEDLTFGLRNDIDAFLEIE